jgi:hypothetical protein
VEPSVGVKETRCSTVKSRHWRFSTTLEDSSVPTVPEHQLRLTLQLPDSLARHLLLAAGFGKRHRFLMVEAVAAHQDVPVAREKPSYALQNPGAFQFPYDNLGVLVARSPSIKYCSSCQRAGW